MDLKRYNEAEVIVKKAIAVAPEKLERYVAYGILLEQQEKMAATKAQYDYALQMLPPEKRSILRLASKFSRCKKYELRSSNLRKRQ